MLQRCAPIGLVLLLGGMVTTASAKKKKDPPASRLFCQAQYAYVRTIDGDVMNPKVLPQDRDAANQLMKNLQAWKRYAVVYQPGEANLVFVVRTGRLASAQFRGSVAGGPYPGGAGPGARNPGAGTQNPPGAQDPGTAGQDPHNVGTGVGIGGKAGPPNDWLEVFTSGNVTSNAHTTLWERSQEDGLMGAQPLFQHLRDAVEETCKDPGTGKDNH